MIAIIDYGMGNLRSVQKAIEASGGRDVRVTSDKKLIEGAAKIVLPGVGAIKPAMDRLSELALVSVIRDQSASGKPFLGICLGYQLLFESSSEGGNVKGLGILPGTVEKFPNTVKVPQMGWNELLVQENGRAMFKGVADRSFVYFCHSYYVKPRDMATAASITDYGVKYASAIATKNIWGVQFHPEKSQAVGLGILRNFVAL
ncbi:MAG: imidazole glycerol phosphate synthase subunit HisH [Candidatus Omnitrophica bacterium]|nr:imidazole glycerol phosphate synthase subunit HisH [Candidatus Omnitrophota bacterium]